MTSQLVTILSSAAGILMTIVILTANVTTRLNKNDSDHMVYNKVVDKLDEVYTRQIKVVTNQERIIKDIAKVADKLDEDNK